MTTDLQRASQKLIAQASDNLYESVDVPKQSKHQETASDSAADSIAAIVSTQFLVGFTNDATIPLPARQQLAIVRNVIRGQRRNIKGRVTAILEPKQAILIDLKYLAYVMSPADYSVGQEVSLEVEFLDERQKIECVIATPQLSLE